MLVPTSESLVSVATCRLDFEDLYVILLKHASSSIAENKLGPDLNGRAILEDATFGVGSLDLLGFCNDTADLQPSAVRVTRAARPYSRRAIFNALIV